jgi:hypothetical protein
MMKILALVFEDGKFLTSSGASVDTYAVIAEII